MRKSQILIAFGKYIAGYRPGDWGWTEHDEAVLSLVMIKSNSEPQTELDKNDNSDLLPCPHCGSTEIRTDPIMFSDDDGEHAGVECMNCDAIARSERWNQRQKSIVVSENYSSWRVSYQSSESAAKAAFSEWQECHRKNQNQSALRLLEGEAVEGFDRAGELWRKAMAANRGELISVDRDVLCVLLGCWVAATQLPPQPPAVPDAIAEFIAKKKSEIEQYADEYCRLEPDTNAAVWDSEYHQQHEEDISEFIAELESVIAAAQQGGDHA